MTDAAKTDRIAGMLARRFPAPRYATMWEVGIGTGFTGAKMRYADSMVLHLWPSDGLELHGFEFKVSRADFRREIADRTKADVLARYCHRWTLITWDEHVVGADAVPPEWGWWSVAADADTFVVHRRAPARTPEPWPRQFAAMLVRRAATESPNATHTAYAVGSAIHRANVESARTLRDAVRAAHREGWARGRGVDPLLPDWGTEGRAVWSEWAVEWAKRAAAR
ncbi:MAG: hypothetical protein U0974_11865 [Gemmatimonadales bacterium]|nr:hypothetical protein [Gemmatimonadales bacterium]MDZ4390412.1 hypothetical protein [Gemmatimonadales bacterium]